MAEVLDESDIDNEVNEMEAELYSRALSGDEIAEILLRKAGQWPSS